MSAGAKATKGELTRQSILEAAITRFGIDGYRATSVTDITREAGVGATVAYSYFPNKEALFLAAVDEDAARVINEGLGIFGGSPTTDWRAELAFALIDSVEQHPLARRLLAGLEPEFTARVLDTPALAELRKQSAEQLRSEQLAGTVRADIDAGAVANGVVAIILSLLMSVVQLGRDATVGYWDDIALVLEAAVEAPTGP